VIGIAGASVVLKLQFLNGSGKSLWLAGPVLRIGTGVQCQLQTSGRGVRELHAEILINGDALLLRSVGGSCFVNKLPVDAEYPLKAGDELRVGNDSWLLVDPKKELDADTALSSLQVLSQAGSRVEPGIDSNPA
jgi:hypothetical protein